MPDKKSDVFNKPTAASTADAAKREAGRVDAADKKEAEQNKPSSNLRTTPFTPSIYHRKYVDAHSVPAGQWGAAVWSTDEDSQEYPCFLDNKGEWWWATTTAQNGINPAVEKTEAPVGWRTL